MAEFTRKALKAIFSAAEIEVPKDVLGQLCDLHTESTEDTGDTIKDLRSQLAAAVKERDELKEKGDGGYKDKYEKEHKAFDEYKTAQAAKETQAAKEKAVRAYFESKGITGKNLTLAMRGCKAEVEALELDGEKIKDSKALDDLVSGDYADLVTTTEQRGAGKHNPPDNNGGDTEPISLADAIRQKYEKG